MLDSRIYNLQSELKYISAARTQLPKVHDQQVEEKKTIQILHNHIPPEPKVDSFLEDLTNRFNKHNIKITLQSSDTKKHDFFNEIQLVLNLEGTIQNHNLLTGIFLNIERYVKWTSSVQGEFTKLELSIYSEQLKMPSSEVHPCRKIQLEALEYWPFISLVTGRNQNIHRLCAQRNNDLGILKEVKKLKSLLQYRYQLEAVAFKLNPGKEEQEPPPNPEKDK